MLQIVIQGRGGQGAQTAGNLLARAFFAQGRQVQAFASYGGARRGTPVSSFIRVDDQPIRLRCDIEGADALLCFDASLLQAPLLSRGRPDAVVVVNSVHTREEWHEMLPAVRVVPVDAIAIARSQGLGRIVNSALLGALAHAIGAPRLEILQELLVRHAMGAENAAACKLGYEAAGAQEVPR
jgi:pyruvate ferredoxin oxidoreductase gamma subunit